MAKRTPQIRQPNRRHTSRLEQERRMRRWLYIGIASTFALVLMVMAWGLVDVYALRPARPVANVGEDVIRTDEYQDVVRYRRYDTQMYLATLSQQRAQFAGTEGQEFLVDYLDQQIQQVQQSYALLPTQVLDQMVRNLIIRQEAARRGITVSEDEVQLLLEEQFGYDRNPGDDEVTEITETPTVAVEATAGVTTTDGVTDTETLEPTAEPTPLPTAVPTAVPMTEDEFTEQTQRFFETIEAEVGFTEAQFRRLLESSLYQDKVEAALTAEIPATAEQVHARHILVATAEEAQQVLDRLAAGEDFGALAEELSTDTGSGAQGGDLGWFARGQMVAPFEEAAFTLEPGTVSEPIATDFGYHIIEVLERDDDRALEGDALAAYQSTQLEAWYAERMAEDAETSWSADLVPEDRAYY